MAGIHDYGLYVLACLLLNVTPGQDTFYILGRSIGQGRRIGVASALGVAAGTVVHALAAALGLSAVIATSATAFTLIKWAGAAYLVYLGVRTLVTARAAVAVPATSGRADARLAFRQGMLTNVLNPKVALFFLAFLPQFLVPGTDAPVPALLLLGFTFVATGTVWVVLLAVASAAIGGALARRPGVHAWLLRAMGALFVFLGVRLLATQR
ncbi:MAG: LysE family translocator [Burkholderiales bacterium]